MLAGAFAFLLFVAVVQSDATPIRPDMKKVLAQPPGAAATQFPVARAGWDGPEMQPAPRATPNPTLERLNPSNPARAVRASLLAAAIPDYRIVAGLVLIILLLRRMGKARSRVKPAATISRAPEDRSGLPRAA